MSRNSQVCLDRSESNSRSDRKTFSRRHFDVIPTRSSLWVPMWNLRVRNSHFLVLSWDIDFVRSVRFLHRSDHLGDRKFERRENDAERLVKSLDAFPLDAHLRFFRRDLQIYSRTLSILQWANGSSLAKFHPAQSLAERLFREITSKLGRRFVVEKQRQLLDLARKCEEYVWKRDEFFSVVRRVSRTGGKVQRRAIRFKRPVRWIAVRVKAKRRRRSITNRMEQVLFYPHAPVTYHSDYSLCHNLILDSNVNKSS